VTLAVVNSIAAFDHMLDHHTPGGDRETAHICSNSYGPTSGNDAPFNPDSAINVAAYEAYQAGILVTFAAGNSGPGTNTLSAYAKAPYVLGVAATTDEKVVTDFSSRGRKPDYDGETNNDRDLAMANFLDRQAARDAEPADRTPTGQTPSTSGVTGGAVVVGLNQTSEPFTIQSADTTPDRYELDATLTWSPESPDVEPSDLDLTLLDANGDPVATTGSGGTGTRQEPEKELTAVVEAGATYQYEITGWRGAAQYEVSGEVLAVEAADDAPNSSPPYGIYRPGVGAPGNLVLSTMSPNDPLQATDTGTESSAMPYYAAISGTSMATPVTSGIAALVYSAYIKEHGEAPTPTAVIEALESTAEYLPDAKSHTVYNIGRGFVDAEAALDAALNGGQTPSDTGPSVERFDAYDRNPNDQNATIAADYAVSDPDGDLASLTVELSGTDGTSQTRSPSVEGGSASGTVSFDRVTRAGGETYTVTLTVTDDTGTTATADDTVTVAQKGRRGGRTVTPTAGSSYR
jgi:subtilisin family serine protease